MGKRLTNEEFIEKCVKERGDKFDYSLVKFVKWTEKIAIKCNTCSNSWNITPINFIANKNGCPICKIRGHREKCKKEKLTTEIFINRSNIIHNFKYNYELSEYKNSKSKISIICKEHGEFEQIAYDHMSGIGCSKCRVNKLLSTKVKKGLIKSSDQCSEFEKYKNSVWSVTEKNYRLYKNVLDPLSMRSIEFNLDHIFSIQQGFTNNIDPTIIGNYTNLRIIPALENRNKHSKCDKTIEQLIEDYNKENNK